MYRDMAFTLAWSIPLMLGISYLLALIEHPNAYWLWHNVLGVL